ncbi:MAG: ABC transporter ATP-binding protein [Aphanocapsa feldmannii 288cV]|nr:MAG: ABC transporter ATP-binding protein [Aphanocapsa feldmannii 288cV]
MTVEPGEVVIIIGPNGAGKSTVMKAIFGMLTISAGRIVLEGREITDTPSERVVRRGLCYVPQVSNVFVTLSVQENLEMGAYLRGDAIRESVDMIYGLFPDLAGKRHQPAGSLSGGQRQMVAMGRALMLEPKVLMLDEPTAGLSPRYRGVIFETVKRINSSGVAILMVEQNARQALGIADRAYVLVDGENRLTGTGAALLADREVARLFLGGRG